MNNLKTVGKSEIRVDAWEKVNGSAKYVADIQVPNLKHGVVLRSNHHHAHILSIETEKAMQIPGVVDIVTAKDIPGETIYGPIIADRPPLAGDRVRFMGEPVAIIIADSVDIARQACKAVQVNYEPLPAVFDPEQALQVESPAVHPDGNLCSHFHVEDGNIESGFSQADLILEDSFSVPRIYPGYLETENSLALWDEDGKLTVWFSSQKPFADRHTISQVLGMPEEDIRVKMAVIGGAFGGKEDSNLAVLTALAAWKSHCAVKIVNTREESMLAHPKRHPARLYYKVGVKNDGEIVALQAKVYMDTGAYASYGPAVGQLLTETIPGPYHIPNVSADTYVVYTNSPVSGAMRGFGSPQTNFAYESLMDMLAHRLGMNAVEIRRKNIWKPGDRNFTRVIVNQAEALEDMLNRAAQSVADLKKIPAASGKQCGVGLALAVQTMGVGRGVPDDSTHQLEWLPNGKVLVRVGAPDLGQGLNTVAAQMAAEALGMDYSQMETALVDTAISPDGGVTCASRMTYMTGNALQMAAQKLVESLRDEASRLLGIPREKLVYQNGALIRTDQDNANPISAADVTSRLAEEDKQITASGTFSFPYGPEIPDHLPIGMPHVKFCLAAMVARVEIDPELGIIEPTHIVSINDLGKVVNPILAEGQIEGGIAMGLGYGLTEEMRLKGNQQWVNRLSEYLFLTTQDMPRSMETIMLEYPESTGPYGVKGIAEIATVPEAAAIANAVFEATGIRVHRIPIRREELVNLK
jgi:CO/xanthine dehydrogenase Mo-binding subunit